MLETHELIFRPTAGERLVIRFADIESARAVDDALELRHPGGTARFELGPTAAKWLKKIQNPPTRAAKLGVKPGIKVAVIDVSDATLVQELRSAGAKLLGARAEGADLVLFGAETGDALSRLEPLRMVIQPAGAIWVIRPKGVKTITEAETMAAGKKAGLVDVKVAAFSPTHTAEKYVIPVKKR